jgi:Cu(I)/Ag(I) efflux system membrane fusion protein
MIDPNRLTARQKLKLAGLVILKRVRFLLILLAVAAFVGYWDTITNYWDKWTRPARGSVRELAAGQEFSCPMHPQVVRAGFEPNGDVPNCPICGMPLSIRAKGEAAPLPPGVTGRVQLTPERIQLAGIKTVAVEYRPMSRQVSTVGYVTFDESRTSRIVSRVEGYVEKLYIDKTFDAVHEGDPLAEIYSPELFSAAQELILASRQGATADLAAAARKKLLLLGVAAGEIDAMLTSGRASPRLTIRSPRTGCVIEKKIVAGAGVEPRMPLLEVADLSQVWIEADVYEKDIAFLQPGQAIEATVEAFPNRLFQGKLATIYPELDTATRTARVRLELGNPGQELRPGMYATVRIDAPLEAVEPFKSLARTRPLSLRERAGVRAVSQGKNSPHPNPLPRGEGTEPPQAEFLAVPQGAVVDTGVKKIVYVERQPGLFEGMELELGPASGDYYPVLRGLSAGDRVAAAGGFLIDAETRLNPGVASTWFGASGGSPAGGRPSTPAAPGRATPGEQAPAGQPQPEAGPARPAHTAAPSAEELENINQLPAADRPLALAQGACPITGVPLGSMGVPVKIILRGEAVFLCCSGCVGKAKHRPDETLKTVAELKKARQ